MGVKIKIFKPSFVFILVALLLFPVFLLPEESRAADSAVLKNDTTLIYQNRTYNYVGEGYGFSPNMGKPKESGVTKETHSYFKSATWNRESCIQNKVQDACSIIWIDINAYQSLKTGGTRTVGHYYSYYVKTGWRVNVDDRQIQVLPSTTGTNESRGTYVWGAFSYGNLSQAIIIQELPEAEKGNFAYVGNFTFVKNNRAIKVLNLAQNVPLPEKGGLYDYANGKTTNYIGEVDIKTAPEVGPTVPVHGEIFNKTNHIVNLPQPLKVYFRKSGTTQDKEATTNKEDGSFDANLAPGKYVAIIPEQKIDASLWKSILGGTVTKVSGKSKEITVTTAGYDPKPDVTLTAEKEEVAGALGGVFGEAMAGGIRTVLNGLNVGIQWVMGLVTWSINESAAVTDSAGLNNVMKGVRNTALALLTLGLLIIAFANILNIELDKYGVNRMIPRLVIAIVMCYFSLLISQFLLEVATALTDLLINSANLSPDSISGAKGSQQVLNNLISEGARAVTGTNVSQAIMLVIILIGLLIVVAWVALLMVVRRVVLFFLVAIAPLAFIMQILPFTEFLYKQWWQRFWKWAFMGPAVAFFLYMGNEFLINGYFFNRFQNIPGKPEEWGADRWAAIVFDPDGWTFLVLTAVCWGIAAFVPVILGKDIFGQIKSLGGKWGGKLPPVKRAKEAWKQKTSATDARRSEEVRAWRRGKALKGGLGSSFLTGIKGGELPAVEEEYIKAKQDKYASWGQEDVVSEFENNWDSLSALDRRALARNMIERKAVPKTKRDEDIDWNDPQAVADQQKAIAGLQKLAAETDLWSKDSKATSLALDKTPDLFARMSNAGVDLNAEANKNIKKFNGLSMSKKASEWKPENVRWMARDAEGRKTLLNALRNQSTVEDIMKSSNKELQAELGRFLHEPGVDQELSPHLTDQGHIHSLQDMAAMEAQRRAGLQN